MSEFSELFAIIDTLTSIRALYNVIPGADGRLHVFLDCHDLFSPGADTEEVTYSDLMGLLWVKTECENAGIEAGNADLGWLIKKRKQRPRKPYQSKEFNDFIDRMLES